MPSANFSTLTRPMVIGHRGASGHALENSIAAFSIAANPQHRGHCDGVELDIHVTADGELIVHHDATLPGGELIAALPASGVRTQRLADGSCIPTLAEAIEVLAGIELFVEAKGLPAAADATLAAELARHGGARHHVHSFDHRIIARLHQRYPTWSLGVLSTTYLVDPVEPVRQAGAATLWQERSTIDADLVATCRQAGIAVIAWTVNDERDASALAGLGVTGLCGNWPERLRP